MESMSTATTNSLTEIIGRSFELRADQMSPDVAQFFLSIELADEDKNRLNALAEKARQGALTEEEQAELEEYRCGGRIVELMKLKARIALDECQSNRRAPDG